MVDMKIMANTGHASCKRPFIQHYISVSVFIGNGITMHI